MKTRISSIILLALTSFSSRVYAQHALQGTVKNAQGEILSDVKLVLEKSYQGTYTDVNGQFKIQRVNEGVYVLKSSLLGYETLSQTIEMKDKDLTIDLVLSPSALMIEEMQVSATRANEKTPTTYTNIDKNAISTKNFGQDLPYLLEGTPSTVVTSDAGGGVGYTGIRIRGVDPTRTNVTINGIPINDSESHGTFWVNMPDFASSTESIQVQRGVGTSSNGAAAFGASINIKSDQIQKKSYGELSQSIGSFNTLKSTIKVGTGLINNKFIMDARLSKISSNGYIDRASSDLKSFYLSGAWIGKKSVLRATVFSGQETTYQAWYGTPESILGGNPTELNAYADRNGLSASQRQNLLEAGRTYNFYDYKNEVDHYNQTHYQLHFNHTFSSKLNLSVAGHYTHGEGYYEQYRADDELADYGLPNVIQGGDTITSSDLIRRRWLKNDFYGAVFSLNYQATKKLKFTWGGGANKYDGAHFGEIIWARTASTSSINDEYYRNDAQKTDLNSYLKTIYEFKKMTAYLDLQVRHIDYRFLGIDAVGNTIQEVPQSVNYTFFNPKVGLMYDFNANNSIYASYSIANREPVRDDFRSSTPDNRPKNEMLRNLEFGYRHKAEKYYVNANGYWMDYKNQLILTGKINDVGGYTRTNAAKSYRLGFEMEGGYRLAKRLNISANLNVSQNKLADFNEFIDDYDNGGQAIVAHKNTDIAFSPSFIGGIGLNYEVIDNLNFTVLAKHVGKQYLDNTSNEDRKIKAYSFGNVSLSYTIKEVLFKEIELGIMVNNIWNSMYENNGYTFSYIYGGQTTTENFYYPQAGTNFLARVVLKL